MTLPGETVHLGAPHPNTPLRVCHSAAGYYIGYLDTDGSPYSRESVGYYGTSEAAQSALDSDTWQRRTTEWTGSHGLMDMGDRAVQQMLDDDKAEALARIRANRS